MPVISLRCRRILIMLQTMCLVVCDSAFAQEDAHAKHKDKFIGTYTLVMRDTRTGSQFNTVCEIKADRIVIDEKDWGAWEAKTATTMTITPADPKNGEVRLTRKQSQLIGQETKKLGAEKWSMVRVYVVAKWRHQAGNQQPIEMPLWSTGRAFKPDGRIKWKINPLRNELILEWPETTDRCKLSSDGNRYEGRNEHGTLITGKKIP